ncbi:hypothetical protein KFK09_001489 [Dendrobium nobile]|uniref:Uncharacterized protein n=1 Tax=Dendrobium nobile TaxID=94219 RepID=A0A8T3CB02_DENNO|nr:hypothetical protein KFK09_001489 [Dendrobium nobile]
MTLKYPKRKDNTPIKGEFLFIWISRPDNPRSSRRTKKLIAEESQISNHLSLRSRIRVVGSGARPL